jgi:hypothetical protein
MRIMAFFWVVWGHEFAYRVTSSLNYIEPNFFNYTSTSWGFTLIEAGFYAVDIFLFMGGFVSILAVSKYVNSFQKAKVGKWIPIYVFCILKRYVRIMPAYAVMMLYYWKVNPALVSGPFASETYMCNSDTFWHSWLIPLRSSITEPLICAGWCWYLAVDFALYMCVPIICLIVKTNKKLGVLITGSLAGICTIWTIIVVYKDKVHFLNYDDNSINKYYYPKFYLRGNTYFLGCLMSYMTMKGPPRKPKPVEQEPELTEDEKRVKEVHEKEIADKKKQKRIRAAKKIGLIIIVVGIVLMTVVTLVLHYYF